MNHKEKFNETVGILVRAYMNGALLHGHPCGCAVGNLIAAKIGARVNVVDEDVAEWIQFNEANMDGFDWYKRLYPNRVRSGNPDLGAVQIAITGYSLKEIASIELAFESTVMRDNGCVSIELDADGHAGLMAVVDVLAEIHGIDLTEKESAKLLFVKA